MSESQAGAATGATPAVAAPESILQLTDKAIAKIRQFAAGPEYAGKTFRVYIEGGGCSGFQYGFTFDEARQDDSVLEVGGVPVLVDPQSAMYLSGSTVDWQEGLTGAGFVVRNPNATGSCGCGMSFSV